MADDGPCGVCGFDFAAAGLPRCTVCGGAKRLLGIESVAEVTAEQLAERDHLDLLLAIAENSGDQAEVLDHLRAIHRWAMEVVAHG